MGGTKIRKRRPIVRSKCQAYIAEEKLKKNGALYGEEFYLERPIYIKCNAIIDNCTFTFRGGVALESGPHPDLRVVNCNFIGCAIYKTRSAK